MCFSKCFLICILKILFIETAIIWLNVTWFTLNQSFVYSLVVVSARFNKQLMHIPAEVPPRKVSAAASPKCTGSILVRAVAVLWEALTCLVVISAWLWTAMTWQSNNYLAKKSRSIWPLHFQHFSFLGTVRQWKTEYTTPLFESKSKSFWSNVSPPQVKVVQSKFYLS